MGLFVTALSNTSPNPAERRRDNEHKCKKERFQQDMRKNLFTVRIVKCWKRLPREVMQLCQNLWRFLRMDKAPSNLISYLSLL